MSNLLKAKFFIVYDVVFLVKLQRKLGLKGLILSLLSAFTQMPSLEHPGLSQA